MDAPKCKSCGERHWEPVCPKFLPKKQIGHPNKIVEGLKRAVAHAAGNAPETVEHHIEVPASSNRVKNWRNKNPDLNKERNRKYAADRRAKKRLTKDSNP